LKFRSIRLEDTCLCEDRPTVVILASGSDFVTGINRGRIDMATPYMREALRFIAATMCVVCRSGRRPDWERSERRARAHRASPSWLTRVMTP